MKNKEALNTLVYRVNKRLKQGLADMLRTFNITTDQWIILRKVYLDSGHYNQRALAQECYKEYAAITRMIDIMEKKNLLERRNSKEDRREYILYITDKGKELYEATLPTVERSYDQLNSYLTDDEIEIVVKILSKLDNGLAG